MRTRSIVGYVSLLVVLASLVVAPTAAGADELPPFTFDPADPVALPITSNAFVTASSPGGPECESMDADITVTVAGFVITSTDTQRADGSIDVYFTPYTPGDYVVTAECNTGGSVGLITGTVSVVASDAPDQPSLSAAPSRVEQGGTIEVQADKCTFAGTPGTVELWIHATTGVTHQDAATGSDGTATFYLGDFPVGTYSFQATCIGAGSSLPRYVYPQMPTAEVLASLGDDAEPSPTTTTSTPRTTPGKRTPAPATPRFTG